MEEFDSHTEHAQEQAHEAAHESHKKWVMGVALTAAILAAFAAITSMISAHNEHDATMLMMEASDHWNEYQAKKIKTILRQSQIETLEAADKPVPEAMKKKITAAEADEKRIADEAKAETAMAHFKDDLHMMFAIGVTLFQVAIAVSAIAALTQRKRFWFVGIALGCLALGFLSAGIAVSSGAVGHKPPTPAKVEAEPRG